MTDYQINKQTLLDGRAMVSVTSPETVDRWTRARDTEYLIEKTFGGWEVALVETGKNPAEVGRVVESFFVMDSEIEDGFFQDDRLAPLLQAVSRFGNNFGPLRLDPDDGEWEVRFEEPDDPATTSVLIEGAKNTLENFMPPPPMGAEGQIESIVNQIIKNPTNRAIEFRGKSYVAGQSVLLNKVLNQALEEAGSDKRVFISGLRGNEAAAIMVIMASEEKIMLGSKEVRVVVASQVLKPANMDTGFFALNDGQNTVVIFKNHVDRTIAGFQQVESGSQPYKTAIFNKVVDYVKTLPAKKSSSLFATTVMVHEKGHYTLNRWYGYRLKGLEVGLKDRELHSLSPMIEMECDLLALESLLKNKKHDTTDQLLLWAAMRGGKQGHQNGAQKEGAVANLILSAVEFKNGKPTCDLKVLEERLDSLKEVTKKNLQTISFNLIQDIVAATGTAPDQQAVPGVWYQLYELIQQAGREDFKKRMPDAATEEAVEITLVYAILDSPSAHGQTVAQVFSGDILYYERKIDDWFRQNLGLDNTSVPFQAPFIIRMGMDGKPLPE